MVILSADVNSLDNNAYANVFKGAIIMATRGSEVEQNNIVWPTSTVFQSLTNKGRDLSSNFVKIEIYNNNKIT